MEPIDRAEPTDPTESTDPTDPIDSTESCDHRDSTEPEEEREEEQEEERRADCTDDFVMGPSCLWSAPGRRLRATTSGCGGGGNADVGDLRVRAGAHPPEGFGIHLEGAGVDGADTVDVSYQAAYDLSGYEALG
jgi:hypothetical protein